MVRIFKATGCRHHEDTLVFEVDLHGETSLELTGLEGVVADVQDTGWNRLILKFESKDLIFVAPD